MTGGLLNDPGSRKAHVLLANDPRSYREAMAVVIRKTRPDVEVETADPSVLDERITPPTPDMVICSKVTGAVKSKVPVWVELYPEHGARSVASIRGKHEEYDEIQLPDLLAILDRAVDVPA